MKKVFIYIFILVFMVLSPLLFLESGFVVKADGSGNVLGISLDGESALEEDLMEEKAISSSFDPIGTEEDPYTGTLDGKGHTVEIKNCGFNQKEYQGLFGYAKNATIKNLKIKCTNLELDLSVGAYDQYIVGVLLGCGENVKIVNCEVEGNVINKSDTSVQSMTTFGGIVGQLIDGSEMLNSDAYLQLDLDYNLTRVSALTFGGAIGTISDSSKINYTIANNVFNFENKSKTIAGEVNIGGVVGKIMDYNTKISNSTSVMKHKVTKSEDSTIIDSIREGGVAAVISNPAPAAGNLKSIAFYMFNAGKENQVTDYYGNSDEVVYSKSASDYVISVSEGVLRVERFYNSSLSYGDYEMEWDENDWNFASIWIMANGEAHLQQFQSFTIEFSSPVDERDLLTKTSDSTSGEKVPYGVVAIFEFEFKDANNNGYYDILDIKRSGESINFANFELYDDEFRDAEEDWNFSLKKDTINKQYIFKIKASNLTEGTYSFVTSSITYDVYVVANEGGKVKTANVVTQALDPRSLHKDALPYVVSAVSDYQYAFDHWTIWQKIEEKDYTGHEGDTEFYYKHQLPMSTTYWKKGSFKIVDSLDISKRVELSISLGSEDYTTYYLDSPQEFLLKANFVENTYDFTIKNLDLKKLLKVEVLSHGGLNVATFDSSSLDSDKVKIDKNEQLTLKLYVKSGFELDEKCFNDALKAIVADKMQVTIEDEALTLYYVTMSSSNFKDFIDASGKMSLEIKAVESKDADKTSSSIWIYIAIGAGVLLILAIVIIIIIKKKRGGKGKEESFDYKKYYN